MAEILYQGSKDVFLARVRADFDAVEDQALKGYNSIKSFSLLGSDPSGDSLFTQVSNVTSDGDRAVWRNISVAGVQNLGNRSAGGIYPDVSFIRGWETVVYDPDTQVAGKFTVPEERDVKEAAQYRGVLNRAQKLLYEISRIAIADIWENFNLAFTAPTSYPARFFAKGQGGTVALGNPTVITNPLVSTIHPRADGGTTQSNAVMSGGLSLAFSDTAFWSAREQASAWKDDVGKPMAVMGGRLTVVVPPVNSLVRLAFELTGSEWKTQTPNNDINIHYGQLGRVMSSPYLLQSYYLSTVANTKQWFLIDETIRDPQTGTGLVQVSFVPLQTRVERDQYTDSIMYKVKNETAQGWVDWRNIIGSKGDGAAYTA
jgi:hypothetical protein